MDAVGISYMVLSFASPGPQGFSDPVQAQQVAVEGNNALAAVIANDTFRFGGLASLSMHNATEAAIELRRAVTELGLLGAILNDYQQSGADNSTLLFYDSTDYDPFWQMVQELDVPVYLHPRTPVSSLIKLEWSGARSFLIGAAWQFAAGTSEHALSLCINGVFDRFPNVTVILGHMGEHIPSDLFRIDQQLGLEAVPMKKTIAEYYQTNIVQTTSAVFSEPLLDFHISQIGADRILFSIDYPWQSLEVGANFMHGVKLDAKTKAAISTNNAIDVLRLNR
ncbi:amidohydrolase 2 [Sistotremastrum suecicum HHB10207 ss-3]|uniref:Amidohydrolase 2 n=1 Tax=Sistotremastrum suecicum HHB10207 ss-3 TaxID=1314776 RepID=A0A166FSB7_9AGAM|nr:amidohydrolase 2 [Sistotremastrum suecicum HHB10207 ss-3]